MAAGLDRAARLVAAAGQVVVFTGAGVSTESGIPDFRSPTGLWARCSPTIFLPEPMRSEEARGRYWAVSREIYAAIRSAQPNPAHRALVDLDRMGLLDCVITQNVDNLRQARRDRSRQGHRAARRRDPGAVPRLRQPLRARRDPGAPRGRRGRAGLPDVRRDPEAADGAVRRADAERRGGARRGPGPRRRVPSGGGVVARGLSGDYMPTTRRRPARAWSW